MPPYSSDEYNIAQIPTQSGHNGKFLSTDGNTVSWDTPSGGGGGSAPVFWAGYVDQSSGMIDHGGGWMMYGGDSTNGFNQNKIEEPSGMWDSNSGKIAIPSDGIYQVNAHLGFQLNSTPVTAFNARLKRTRAGEAVEVLFFSSYGPGSGANFGHINVSWMGELLTDDELFLELYSNANDVQIAGFFTNNGDVSSFSGFKVA